VSSDAQWSEDTVKRLLGEFTTYDTHVDVVSAFEFLLTVPTDMRATVKHFERFPKIPVVGGETVTPDFTVLYNDGTALIGEVSKLSLHEKSVEKACRQDNTYAQLTQVPDEAGMAAVTDVDVLHLVPMDVGPDAVERIIKQRFLNPDHWYKPPKAPCIVQYARDPDRYMFQRMNDPDNGILESHGRDPSLSERIRQINVPAVRITEVKGRRKFINDPIPALYLATHLYLNTWATEHPATKDEFVVDPVKTAQTVRDQYDTCSADDVRKALEHLYSAGLAAPNGDGTWTVAPRPRGRSNADRDVAHLLARRIASKPRSIVRRSRTAAPTSEQDTLFDV
jgi:hypothetical protein